MNRSYEQPVHKFRGQKRENHMKNTKPLMKYYHKHKSKSKPIRENNR